MRRFSVGFVALALTLVFMPLASGSKIPAAQVDTTKIFSGDPANFESAAEVNLDKVVMATPEYKELVKKKIKRGTAKYWELMCLATDRAITAVLATAGESSFGLVCAAGYLGSCDPAISCEDITRQVIEKVKNS